MRFRYLLPVIAAAGLAATVATLVWERDVPPVGPPPAPAANPPFDSYVMATGAIEAGTGNVMIGTPVSGIVAAVYVKWGDRVAAGDPLFRIDDRDLLAEQPLAAAEVAAATARLAQARYHLGMNETLQSQHVLSEAQLKDSRFAVQLGEAALAAARARVTQLAREIERRIVRAPVAGHVLQINLHAGEFAESAALATPLLVLGDNERLRVRADIDENDVWRIDRSEPAIAVLRANPAIKAQLEFEGIEPYVVPRKLLSGDTTQRVDTRVLQVLYGFERGSLPVYVGQQVDVYIKARAAHAG
jgi:RND family efflux transporter MFP subunit